MQSRRILIVDGSESVRRALETLIRPRGFDVVSASSAAEAARLARIAAPQALLVAARAMGPSPLTALPALQREPALAGVPVIEVDRVQEITREIDDGWQRCGTASRSLLQRLERLVRSPWKELGSSLDAGPTTPHPEEQAAVSGDLALFPLAPMLEWLAKASLSGRFALRGSSVAGAIFLDRGAFVHACLEQPFPCDDDDEAFDLLLTLRRGRFALHAEPLPASLRDLERRPLMGLLVDHLRLGDEAAARGSRAAEEPTELRA